MAKPTLNFDFSDSNEPVDHEENAYIGLILGPIVSGWKGQRLPIHETNVNLGFSTEKFSYTVANQLPDAYAAQPYGLLEDQAVAHSPGPSYYDIETVFNGLHGRLFLRVTHQGLPAPPVWNLESSYDSKNAYDAALTKYQNKLDDWLKSFKGLFDAPFTQAKLLDDGGEFGKLSASSPITPLQLGSLYSYATIVQGSDFGDTIHGGNDHDKLFGGPGDDLLIAGHKGNDFLSGGPGNDTIVAGHGHDTMRGGGGADVFRFKLHGDSPPGRLDVIMDFSHLQRDKINILGFADPDLVFVTQQTFAQYRHHNPLAVDIVRIAPGGLVEATDNGHTVRLEIVVHLVHGHLAEGDFDFHA
jgi:hypothetical protein